MKTFQFLPAVEKVNGHCLCCNSAEIHLPMDTVLCQGFGGWMITKNGELYFMDDSGKEWDEFRKMSEIEAEAAADPDNDWRAVNDSPLHGEVYQRQNDKWVLVEQNQGFA